MRRLVVLLAAALAFTGLLGVVEAPEAKAHGACSVTSITSIFFGTTPATVRMNASTFCSDLHVSTTIEIFLHQNGRSGPIVFADSMTCTDCRAVEIQRFQNCQPGARYVTEAFGFQRQDRHNIKRTWSSAVKCPSGPA